MLPNLSLDGVVCRLQIVEKWRKLFQTVFLWSTNEAYGHTYIHAHNLYTVTHTHTHTHVRTRSDKWAMIALGENATRCMSPTNDTSTISRYRVIAKIVNFRIFDLENESQGR